MRVLTPTLSPKLATESATVRLFFLSALLCSVNTAVCDFAHARPIMHCIHLVWTYFEVGLSVVFIAKTLRWASRDHIITCAYTTCDLNSKRVTRGSKFTTIEQEKENTGSKGSESGKPQHHIGP